MSNTAQHTAKCLSCGRVRRFHSAEAAQAAKPYGRICSARVRLAAIAEAVKDFAAATVDKARELIADGGLVPTNREGVFRAVSSKGDGTSYLTHSDVCNCPAGLLARRCYHLAAARILVAAKGA